MKKTIRNIAVIIFLPLLSCNEVSKSAANLQGLNPEGELQQLMEKEIKPQYAAIEYEVENRKSGDLNGDGKVDYVQPFTAFDSVCTQCWQIHYAIILTSDAPEIFAVENGKGAGGNGTFYRLDSISQGKVHASLIAIESAESIEKGETKSWNLNELKSLTR